MSKLRRAAIIIGVLATVPATGLALPGVSPQGLGVFAEGLGGIGVDNGHTGGAAEQIVRIAIDRQGIVNHTSASIEDVSLRELSPREREVLQLLAGGRSMKEVAAVLDISPRTVEFHKYRIMDHLGVKSNAELVQHAIKLGLIAPPL
jgi:DNA-binding CsgD family transcriptional regulator